VKDPRRASSEEGGDVERNSRFEDGEGP